MQQPSAMPNPAFALHPSTLPESKVPVMGIFQVLRRAATYWRPYWKIGLVILAGMFLQEGFQTFFGLSLQRIIDEALTGKNSARLVEIMSQLGIGYLLAAVGSVGGDYLTARVGASILNDIRRKMFSHLQGLSMDYYAHAQTGNIVAHFTSDLNEIEKGLTARFTDGNLALVGLMLNVPTLFFLEWHLALVTLLVLPLVSLGGRIFAPPASRAFYQLKRAQGALASTVQENARTQPIVKVFGLQAAAIAQLQQQLVDLFRRAVRANFLSMLVGTSSSLGVRLSQLIVIGLGAYLAFNGYMSIGALVAFTTLLTDVCGDAYNLSKKVTPSLIAAGGGLQRIDELLNTQPQVVDAPIATSLPTFSQEIRFEDVSFSYTGTQPILERLNFTIPVGQYVAIVGPSGAGKSTILNLIARFYDVTAGAVMIDGTDLRQVTQESLRQQMAAVLQDTLLFNTTIRENIRLGRLDATDAEIEAAARDAEIHDFIVRLPQGYDTLTGEMGGLISGGQRQRIAIARAILRNPAILLLDEPTSDLDATTEAAINATLERLAKNRTVIAVTHRLAAVQHADRVFVLEAGRIVEQGQHRDLLELNGLYHQLWVKSTLGHQDAPVEIAQVLNHMGEQYTADLQTMGEQFSQIYGGLLVEKAEQIADLTQRVAAAEQVRDELESRIAEFKRISAQYIANLQVFNE